MKKKVKEKYLGV